MPAEPRFNLQTTSSGPDAQVIIRGELDLASAAALAQALTGLCDSIRGGLILHMGEVKFIDCACARIIARAARTWPSPGRVVIRDPSPIVRRVFQLTGLADPESLTLLTEIAAPPATLTGSPAGIR
ncbi:MAG TPA: anti-sigma factor antagonist [Streptosporangiaceae bacterium]|jgi:anti-anti-sigma factor